MSTERQRRGKLLHVHGLVYGTPLAVHQPRLDQICAVLEGRAGDGVALDAATTVQAEGREVEPRITADGIAVLPVMGTFVKRASMIDALSGLTSYAAIAKDFRAAMADPSVRAILLQIDSPGGQVNGMFDLADEIYAARGTKTVWAIADEHALSAAYLLASAAERILVPRTGWLGSIGTLAVRLDETQADDQQGRKHIFITSGSQKTDGNPHEAPTDAELERLQAKVDQVGQLFFEAVARNRRTTVAAIARLEAGTFIGAEAVRAGLADALGTVDDALRALAAQLNRPGTVRAEGGTTMGDLRAETPETPETPTPPVEPAAPAGDPTPETPTDVPAGDPAPGAPSPEARASNVVSIESARKRGRGEAKEIVELCALAGLPQLAAEFIEKDLSVEAVRKELNARRVAASGNEIASHVDPAAGASVRPMMSAQEACERWRTGNRPSAQGR